MKKIKIIIAEDHTLVREGLLTMLNNEPDVKIVGTATNGKEAVELIKKIEPDVAILDISMPIMDGIEAAKIIKLDFPNTKIIILTMHDEDIFIRYINENFISGYVLKENSYSDLIYAIKSVYRGGKFVSPELTQRVISQQKVDYLLTVREKEILQFIVNGNSVKEIANKLIISVKTVETHKNNIMKKLKVNKSTDLVRKVLQENILP